MFFWHFIQESIGQYEIINEKIKDVNLIFIDIFFNNKEYYKDKSISKFSEYIPKSTNFFVDFFNIYSNTNEVHDLAKTNICFENLYIILDFRKIFKQSLFENHGHTPYWFIGDGCLNRHNDPSGEWQFLGLSLLRNKILKNINTENSYSEKIYISREDANLRYKDGSMPSQDAEQRLFEEDQYLKEYFIEKGYVPVTFEGVPNLEQAKIIFNAKSIVSPVGSGLLNTIFCNEDSFVFELHVNPKFIFSYKYVSNHVVKNHFYSIDLRERGTDGKTISIMSMDKIKEILNGYRELF